MEIFMGLLQRLMVVEESEFFVENSEIRVQDFGQNGTVE